MNCTRCDGTGFLNLHQVDSIPLDELAEATRHESIKSLIWYWQKVGANDVRVCDCCGDGENWHGEPGHHDENDFGPSGRTATMAACPSATDRRRRPCQATSPEER